MLKRVVDLVTALVGLTIGAPVLAAIAVLVRVKLGSPVLFRQQRPGLHGEPFTLLKFRTMTDERGDDGELLPNDQRLTPFGRRLRSTSLDELPELVNVLRGEMSLVGPRPLRMEYLEHYSPRQARRHEVRPGITGWAQIQGRNELSWDEKFEMDVWYVENRSFALDLRILLVTIAAVLRRDGITGEGGQAVQPFRGSQPQAEQP
jgi:sugar transferase EpsL